MNNTISQQSSEGIGLREPAYRVDPRAKALWRLSAAVFWALPVVLFALLSALATPWLLIVLIPVLALAAVHIIVVPMWRFQFHRWEVNPVAVYSQAGFFSRTRVIIPVSRIQVVDTEAGPLEQLCGLAKLTVTTASSAGKVRIVGLRREVARHIAHDLSTFTQEHRGDAT